MTQVATVFEPTENILEGNGVASVFNSVRKGLLSCSLGLSKQRLDFGEGVFNGHQVG